MTGNGHDNILSHRTISCNHQNIFFRAAVFMMLSTFFLLVCLHQFETTLVCGGVMILLECWGMSSLQNPRLRTVHSCSECDLWDRAGAKEMSGLLLNNVWVEAVLPPGRRALDTKWIHKYQTNIFGEVVRYKACLVAKGFDRLRV
ncbi:unnamed protein product [Choristocarpus tenellus]